MSSRRNALVWKSVVACVLGSAGIALALRVSASPTFDEQPVMVPRVLDQGVEPNGIPWKLSPPLPTDGDEFALAGACSCDASSPAGERPPGLEDFRTDHDLGDPVDPHNGMVGLRRTDLCLSGRGLGFAFTRSYSSKAAVKDAYPLGQGWDHNYNLTLEYKADLLNQNQHIYVLNNGNNHLNTYRNPYLGNGSYDAQHWYAYGVYSELQVSGTDVILRARHGTKTTFSFAGNPNLGVVTRIEDRNGNHLTFGYTSGKLTSITDPMGRVVTLTYDFPSGNGKDRLLHKVTDPTGRVVTFDYTQLLASDQASWVLVTATSPAAPTATDPIDPSFIYGWPNGKTEGYTYYGLYNNQIDGVLSYNLKSVIAPSQCIVQSGLPTGTPYVQFAYNETDPWRKDWCISQTLGNLTDGQQPTGGTITYTYASLDVTHGVNNPLYGRLSTTVTDRGNRTTVYTFNERGNVLQVDEVDPVVPNGHAITVYEYFWYYQNWSQPVVWGPDGELWRITQPNGTIEERAYLNTANTLAPRWSSGDLTDITLTDTQGNQRHTGYKWDPVYNLPWKTTDENGHVTTFQHDYTEGNATVGSGNYVVGNIAAELWMSVSDVNNFLNNNSYYSTLLQDADLNGDGQNPACHGNIVQKVYPDVSLTAQATGSATVQTWETDHIQQGIYSLTYNSYGQVTSQTDPEENVTVYLYTTETDLDGNNVNDSTQYPGLFTGIDGATGGVLKRVVRDVSLPYSDPQLSVSARPAAVNHDIGRDSTDNPTPKAAITDLVHNLRGNLTSYTDPRGVETDYWVNELEEIWRVAEATTVTPTGRSSAWDGSNETTSSDFGPLTDIIRRWKYDANGLTVAFQRRNTGNLADAGGYTGWLEQTFSYDLLNRMRTRNIEYGTAGQMATWTYTYNVGDDFLDSVLAPEGNTTQYTYTARGQVATVVEGSGAETGTTSFAYDADRNLLSVTDPRGHVTTNSYDGFDRLKTVQSPVGTITRYTYDAASNVLSVIVNGVPAPGQSAVDLTRTEYKYDECNRVYQVDQSDPQSGLTDGALTPGDGKVTTRIDLDRISRRIGTITDAGKTYRSYFDGLSHLVKTIDPLSNKVENFCDDSGNLVKIKQTDQYPGGTTRIFETFKIYDALGRVASTTNNAGDTHRFTYDSRDNVVAASDAQNPNNAAGQINGKTVNQPGNTRSYKHNGFDQVLQEQLDLLVGGNGSGTLDTSNQYNPDGHVIVQTAYDRNGRVTSKTDDNGRATSYIYDTRSRVKQQTFADSTHQNYVFDAASNLTQVTDARGNLVVMTYDVGDRLTNVQATLLAPTIGTQLLAFEYDGLGRRTKSTSSDDTTLGNTDDWSVTRTYDALSRIKVEVQHSNDVLNQRTITSTWAEEAKRTNLLYPSGLNVGFTFDDDARIATIRPAGGTLTTYAYAGNRLHERIYSNGTGEYHHDFGSHADTLYYDDAGRPIKSDYRTIPGALITGFEHAFDRMGNRKYERRLHNSNKGDNYVYDSLYRLTSFERLVPAANVGSPGLSGWTAKKDYKLDGVENWRQLITNNGTPQNNSVNSTEGYSTFGSVTPTYDADGNMTSPGGSPTTTFKYDFLNRLRQVVQGSKTVNHLYDAEGRRVKTTISGVTGAPPTIEYTHDDWDVIEERSSTGALMRRWVNGSEIDEPLQLEVLSFWPNPGTYEFQRSTLGNVVAITNGSGTVLERYTYDAYGTPQFETASNTVKSVTASDYGNPYLFNSRRYDPWIYPLYEYRTRLYSPAMGRFVQRDSIGVWGDWSGIGNPYAYVAGNSPNFRDPAGMMAAGGTALLEVAKAAGEGTAVGVAEVTAGGVLVTVATGIVIGSALRQGYDELSAWLHDCTYVSVVDRVPPSTGGPVPPAGPSEDPTPTEPKPSPDAGGARKGGGKRTGGGKTGPTVHNPTPAEIEQFQMMQELYGKKAKEVREEESKTGHKKAPPVKRTSPNKLKRQWEQRTGRNWPRTDEGLDYTPHHIWPLGDGGPDTAENIEPKDPQEHVDYHRNNGDSSRWGRSGREIISDD